jgi:ketosteroid isomerase-like protein
VAEQSAVHTVTEVYEAFARGDVAAVLGAMADDIEWHEADGMPYGGVHRGGQAIAQNVLGPITTDVVNFAVTPERLIAEEVTVVVVTRYTGVGKETGEELDLPVVHIWKVRNGKLAGFRQFIDTAKFREVVPMELATTA